MIPALVILGTVVETIFLVAREGEKVYDTRYPHRRPNFLELPF
jgi:hypothetical protein